MANSMDARAAYKLGFLARCAEEGLQPAQVQERLQKVAEGWLDTFTSGVALPGAVLAGSLLPGFGAGYLYSQATAPTVESAEDIKQKELIAAYRRAIDRANRITQRVQYRKTQQPRMPRLPSSLMS
jgi:enoyl-CoA hydratase/carnithine racemase